VWEKRSKLSDGLFRSHKNSPRRQLPEKDSKMTRFSLKRQTGFFMAFICFEDVRLLSGFVKLLSFLKWIFAGFWVFVLCQQKASWVFVLRTSHMVGMRDIRLLS
jgi:hypothetical protein